MRLAFRIDLNAAALRRSLRMALPVACAASLLPAVAAAQDFGAGGSGFFAVSAMPAVLIVDAPATIAGLAAGLANGNAGSAGHAAIAGDRSGESDSTVAGVLLGSGNAASMNDIALDDQMLSKQRGGASGMVMVAATPQLMHGNAVTLWDEIAPPAPLPTPVDAARSTQSNVTSYSRK